MILYSTNRVSFKYVNIVFQTLFLNIKTEKLYAYTTKKYI